VRRARAALALALGLSGLACGGAAPAPPPPPGGSPGADQARPRITAVPDAFDFGDVLPGKVLAKEVVVRNHGDADLVLSKVDTTCNCTIAGTYASVIPPGGGTTLRVALTTPEIAGPTMQSVRITSNDPEQRELIIDVKATVVGGPRAPRPAGPGN
jgi:hypothetical protein